MTADSYFHAVADIARLAGHVAHRYYGRDLSVETKSDGTPVTIADRAAEEFARRWIADRFPQDGILGEEFGTSRPDSAVKWIIDPIDGTKSFVRGAPLWGTLVAVAENETVLAGAAYFPALQEIVVAAPGRGCWWNNSRCRVSGVSELSQATVLTSQIPFGGTAAQEGGWSELEKHAAVARTWGDCFGYLLVATGRAEAMADPIVSPWDIAALVPIVTEAGGVLTDWTGATTAFGGSAIATNKALASMVRETLGVTTTSGRGQ